MIEVTDAMREDGMEAYFLGCGRYADAIALVRAYRAMRALEPVAPELRNRQYVPPALRAEDQGRPPKPANVSRADGEIEMLAEESTRCNDRIDALTALTLELARRHTEPRLTDGDVALARLIAELEAAR